MNRFVATLALLAFTWLGLSADEPAPSTQVVSIWPDSPPAWTPPGQPERDTSSPDDGRIAGEPLIRLGFVSEPQLHVFRPQKGDQGGMAGGV